jgi:tetratricopeptide (TPR) repeat protein
MNQDTQDVGGPLPPPQRGLLAWLFGGLRNPLRRRGLASSIGRYRVVRKIGEGGMGTVFEAVDEALDRRVAIKRLKEVDESARRRFRREARAAARLTHPNVCQVYEVGEDSDGPFLAMELLSGEPLSARLKRQPMSAEEVIPLGAGMLAALSAIHAAGLVHRDLKPSNVYLTPYGPRLLDFGLVRQLSNDAVRGMPSHMATADPISGTPLTDGRNLIGSPGYMAPEQILGPLVDARADLFSAGVVLYEALAGHRAFPGASWPEVLGATLDQAPEPLPAPLARLDAFLRRALAKKPAERFATAQEMAEALHAASAAPPAGASATAESEAGEIFVGRTAELAWLEERLAAALAGAGGVVFVTGERGAGKSALVGEMLRRVRDSSAPITLTAGRCLEHQGPRDPLQPFLDALGRLFGTSRGRDQAVDLVKTWAPTVGVLMPTALVPDPDGSIHRQTAGATRERLIREAGDFMDAATRLYPVVLLLEDLQWADPVSVEVLCHLGRRAARQRFLILATCRSSEVEGTNEPLHRGMLDLQTAGQGRELALGPLRAPDVEQWLQRRFPGNDFATALAPLLHARAEGVPLFVRSLFELLAGRRDIEPRPGGFQLARPLDTLDLEPSKDVKDLVRAHLATLPTAERELLAAASVLGKEFSSAIARGLAVGNELELEERMQRLARVSRVLENRGEEELPDGTLGTRYRFAHGLYQRVLYEDLVAPRRGDLHRRAGELLLRHWGENAPSRAVEMAEHFERARDVARAVRFRTLAGEHAVRRFAGVEAVAHYTAGLELLHKQPDTTRLTTAELRPLQTALYGRRASARLLLAQFDEAARDYLSMLERARTARLPAAECEALSGLCNAHFFEQRTLEMSARAREALQAAARLRSPHHLAEARGRVAQALVMDGKLKEARRALDAVIAAARASGSLGALQLGLVYRGFVHYWHGEFQECEANMADALVVCEDRGDGFEAFAVRMFQGLARANLGRTSEALADLEHAEVFAGRNGDRFWQPRLVSQQGYIHRELAAVERARELDARALALARENPSPWTPEVDALLNLCVDGVRAGDPEGAENVLAQLEDGSASRDWFRWMNDLRLETAATEHYAARGAAEATAARASRLEAVAAGVGARNYLCASARLAAEVVFAGGGNVAEAHDKLERALDALRDHPAPLETWKARRALGLLRLRRGDAPGARHAFVKAAADIDTILRGTHQAALRDSFLGSPAVREVLAQAARA